MVEGGSEKSAVGPREVAQLKWTILVEEVARLTAEAGTLGTEGQLIFKKGIPLTDQVMKALDDNKVELGGLFEQARELVKNNQDLFPINQEKLDKI